MLRVAINLSSNEAIDYDAMDLHDVQSWLYNALNQISMQFQKAPGSAIFLRYVKSSYQNDPVRSAVELFLFLFAVRYLLAPSYSTQKKSYVTLSDEVGPALERSNPRSKNLSRRWMSLLMTGHQNRW